MHIRSVLPANRTSYLAWVVGFVLTLLMAVPPHTYAVPNMANRFDQIQDSAISVVTTHRFGFTYTNTIDPVGSVAFEFCSNSPLPAVPCSPPSGLSVSAASLADQSGEAGFTINGSSSTANKLVIRRSPQVPNAASAESIYEFANVTNPDTIGSYYVRLQTFSSVDGTGAALEAGGVVFSINERFNISAEVPPYLRFCASVTIVDFDCSSATSFFVDFGEFAINKPKFTSSEMVAATNAPYGYNITAWGTTLTSGNNIIPELVTQAPSSPGISQFGINLRDNSDPNIGANPSGPGTAMPNPAYNVPNTYRFNTGEAVVSNPGTNDNRKFTVSYIANISTSQAPGIYATTISFICLANF